MYWLFNFWGRGARGAQKILLGEILNFWSHPNVLNILGLYQHLFINKYCKINCLHISHHAEMARNWKMEQYLYNSCLKILIIYVNLLKICNTQLLKYHWIFCWHYCLIPYLIQVNFQDPNSKYLNYLDELESFMYLHW